jgi:glycosyltransferase involved in cell wall biosynthesis
MEHEYYLCLDERYDYSGSMPPGEVIRVSGISPLKRLWWDQAGVSRLVEELDIDAILSLLTFGPVRPAVPQVNLQRTPVYFFEEHLDNLSGYQKYITLLRRLLLKQVMRGSAAIVTPSAAMRDAILRVFPDLSSRRFEVIPHGFDKNGFKRSLEQARSNGQHRGNSLIRILYVSHFLPHKDFEIIPPVAHQLANEGMNFRIMFTGSREDWPSGYDRMMQDAKRLGVIDYLDPLGRVPHERIAEIYAQADLFFFPSLCESFGFPMVEAMGTGLPAVASDTSINREIYGSAALYFNPGKPDEASSCLVNLIEHSNRRYDLSQSAMNRFRNWAIDMNQYATQMLDLLTQVVCL